MNNIKLWFEQLDGREKKMVLGIALGLFVLIAYFLVWQPVSSKSARVERVLKIERNNLQWMRANVPEILRLKGTGSNRPVDLTRVANAASVANSLAIKSIQPKGNNEAQIVFEKVSFNKVLDWLYTLEQENGLILKKVSITDTGENNIVNARVNISKGV